MVVVIIAVITAGALLSVSVTGRDRDLERESQRLLALLQYTQEQAQLRTREFGLLCDTNRFQFVEYDPRKDLWVAVTQDDALRGRELPDGLNLSLTVERKDPQRSVTLASNDEGKIEAQPLKESRT